MDDELQHLEHEGWHSLCTGTGSEFYGRVMTEDGLMVLANGQVMTRTEVVAALREAPAWASYDIADLRKVPMGADTTALVYVGTAHRDQGAPVVAAMTSCYVRRDGQWRLALYTQTPVPGRVIDLALAAQMTGAALEQATAMGALVSAAVVDQGGNLVHFQRMDRAEIAGPTLAVDKGYTAVAHRIATAKLGPLTAPGGPLQGMHANGGGRYVVFAGGLPCWDGDVVVGGIGVSGGTAEEDAACAAAALAVFEAAATAATGQQEGGRP